MIDLLIGVVLTSLLLRLAARLPERQRVPVPVVKQRRPF